MQLTILRQVNGAVLTFNKYERLREWFVFQDGCIGHFSITAHPASHFHKNICNIFAFYFWVDTRRVTMQRVYLTKEKTANVQNVRTHIREDKFFKLRKKGLIIHNWKA